MDQQMASALSQGGEQTDVGEEMVSFWAPIPGCDPNVERAVHDLLVWETDWNQKVMERNKKADVELRQPSDGAPPQKRRRIDETPPVRNTGALDLPPWEEVWDIDLASIGLPHLTIKELTSPSPPPNGPNVAKLLPRKQENEQLQEQVMEQSQYQYQYQMMEQSQYQYQYQMMEQAQDQVMEQSQYQVMEQSQYQGMEQAQ